MDKNSTEHTENIEGRNGAQTSDFHGERGITGSEKERRILTAEQSAPLPGEREAERVWGSLPTTRAGQRRTNNASYSRRSSGKSSSQYSCVLRGMSEGLCSSPLRNSTRRILPEIVFGRSANSSRRTRLNGDVCPRTKRRI